MQTNDNSHSLDTPSISKIHHNLQNTLNTSFWLLIDFDSPTQSSEGRQPHFTKKQPRPRDGTREAPLTAGAVLRLRLPAWRTFAVSSSPWPGLRREWAVAAGFGRSPFWGCGGHFRGLSPFWSSSSLRKTPPLTAGKDIYPLGWSSALQGLLSGSLPLAQNSDSSQACGLACSSSSKLWNKSKEKFVILMIHTVPEHDG